MIRFFHLFAFVILSAILPYQAYAQSTALPSMPAPIENLVAEGAQVRYLGKDKGLDAWITVKNGKEQYFYVLPDQSAFVMGLLFDDSGKLVTVRQVDRLRAQGDDLLDNLADIPIEPQPATEADAFKFKTPSERLFTDIEGSNWVALGQRDAPVVYSFIDPQCPHCHAFINDLLSTKALEEGKVQLRLIPVGFKDETRAQAAYLIAAPDPQMAWMRHMAGDEQALPARSDINQQGVQRNLSIMTAWKFNVTPMIIYRANDNSVKIIRGRANDIAALLNDIRR